VNFALRSTISRWRGISRIRPGYPICVAAGKLAHFFIADPVSSLAGASVASTLLGLADFLPFTLIVSWSVSGYLALFRRPVGVRAAAPVVLAAVTVLPSFFLVGGLAKVPPGRRSGLDQGAASSRSPLFRPPATPRVVLLARRHALFYWPEEETRLERRATPTAGNSATPSRKDMQR